MSDEHWPPPHDPATCPDCIRARTPRRLQSDSATYVEGREAPEGDALVGAGAYPPRSARREGREAPCPHGGVSRTACMTCNRKDGRIGAAGVADVGVIEACARAGFDASLDALSSGKRDKMWSERPGTREHWTAIARAVLAAAGRGGR